METNTKTNRWEYDPKANAVKNCATAKTISVPNETVGNQLARSLNELADALDELISFHEMFDDIAHMATEEKQWAVFVEVAGYDKRRSTIPMTKEAAEEAATSMRKMENKIGAVYTVERLLP